MKYYRFCVLAVFLFHMCLGNAFAFTSGKQQKLVEYAKVSGLYEMVQALKVEVEYNAKKMAEKRLESLKSNNPYLNGDYENRIMTAYNAYTSEIADSYSVDGALASWMDLMSQSVNEQELDMLIAFYQSPTGRKCVTTFVKTTPIYAEFINRKAAEAIGPALDNFNNEITEIMISYYEDNETGVVKYFNSIINAFVAGTHR